MTITKNCRVSTFTLLLLLGVACGDSSAPATAGSGSTPDPSPPASGDPFVHPVPVAPPGGTEPPEGPAVRFVGRFDERDPGGPMCGWPGCRIIASFEGTAVSVRLIEEEQPDGPSEWDVAIDGKWQSKLVLTVGERTYDLASQLPSGTHRVELYKRSESQTGVTQFRGFDFHGGVLKRPPPRAERHLEIVGDSDVSGYGYEGAAHGGDCGGTAWLARYQNFRAAWGARLAEKLGADLEGTVFSGKGLYFNAWRPDEETIDLLYPRANPEDSTSTFDLHKIVPDVVIVSIGGNDYNLGQPVDTGPAPLAGFTEKARLFTSMLRRAYPKAHLFLMAYATLTDDDPPGRGKRTNVVTAFQTVVHEHASKGDAKVYFIAPPVADHTELTACDGHGGPEYHERIATFLAREISTRTGWSTVSTSSWN